MKNDSKKSQNISEVEVNETNGADKEKKQKRIIIILAILLALSVAGLVARFLYLQYLANTPVTVEVPDNIISEDKDKSDGSGTTGTAGFGVPANSSPGGSSELTGGGSDKSRDDSSKPSDNGGKDNNDNNNNNDNNGDDPSEPDNPDNPDDPNTPDNPDNPDNPGKDDDKGSVIIIPGREAIRLSLFKDNTYTDQPFEVHNMFPGDDEQKLYCIRIYHDRPTTLYFKATVTAKQSPLEDNLKLKAVNLGLKNGSGTQNDDKQLFDSTFGSVNGQEYSISIPYSSDNTTDVYFRINGYLPKETGNDCENKSLMADFEWYVKDAEGSGGTVIPVDPDKPDNPDEPDNPDNPDKPDKPDNPDEPDKPDNPDKPDKPDKPNKDNDSDNDGHLINPPKTGDVTNVTLWSVMTVSALLLLIITFRTKRKEEAEDDK